MAIMATIIISVAITSSDTELPMMIGSKLSIVNNYLYYINMNYLTISAVCLTFFDKNTIRHLTLL